MNCLILEPNGQDGAVRCSNCGHLLPPSAKVERWETPDSCWLLADCLKCGHSTPVQLEKKNLMIPSELIADLPLDARESRESLLYACILLRYLADVVESATLSNGSRILDPTDMHYWLDELAEVLGRRSTLLE